MLYLDIISLLIILLKIFHSKAINIIAEYSSKKRILEENNKKEMDKMMNQFSEKEKNLKQKYDSLHMQLEIKENRMKNILYSVDPFKSVSSLIADAMLYVYDETSEYLKYKKHPALVKAKEVQELKADAKIYIANYKEMLYKYEFLLNTFPELQKYVDDYEALKSLQKNSSYDEFIYMRDNAIDYLSSAEWNNLDVDERNQLALDRYKLKKKSNWIIGIEYEMYIDYLLRKSGYKTIPYGSTNGLEDLGRDIIAYKTNNEGQNVVYIIQCKNWASNKEIHENVVCQVFGTTVEYMIRHKGEMFTKVVPVIYTTVPLSEMAHKFAEILKVIIRVVKKGEYPMIKCNISSDGSKIYHLPFDQQYYKTEIKNAGEFYAWTVKEAVDAGFRRAFRYNLSKSNLSK